MIKTTRKLGILGAACALAAAASVSAQTGQILFSDTFDTGTIDPAKWRADERPFESGTSDIRPDATFGVLEFAGTVTEQWWPGTALATVPEFTASMETNLVISVERLAEMGIGSASRSALFITDATRNHFVLFADVRGEGGWRYNRKIGQNGDSANGSGVDIEAFNSAAFDDGGYHQMKVVANGETVKLYLDEVLGAEVAFPYTEGIVVQLGSYARANGDTAHTQFDNFQVAAVGAISFAQQNISVAPAQTSGDVTVRIPNGSNATQPVQVQVVSADPSIGTPVGGQNGVLTLTFAAGGATSQTFKIQGVKSGGTVFTLQNDRELITANTLAVNVPFPIGTLVTEDFSTPLSTERWQLQEAGFETGAGNFDVRTEDGQLGISGELTVDYWGGASVRTVESYTASKDLMLSFEVDRVSMERAGTAGRSGIFITSADRSRYVSFQQNHGENGWTVNVSPGNPTGGGTTLDVLNSMNDLENHRLRLLADGETVQVFLDDVLGGTFPFPVSTGIHFEIGAYARATGDTINARFDNARISTVLPCIIAAPADVTTELGVDTREFEVVIPRLLNETAPATVTITSRDPSVAIPAGATSGSLTLNFAAGASNRQTVRVQTVGAGLTTFDVASAQGGCVTSPVAVTVTPALATLLADDFGSAAIDSSKWTLTERPLEAGTLTNSTATQTGGQVQFHVTPGTDWWPGYAYLTTDLYSARATEPLVFEVDRVSHVGTGASTRTGVWITDATGANRILFSYDDNFQGWQYNRVINQAGDTPTGAVGVNIAAFDAPAYNAGGNVRLKVVANGATAKFYINDVLGAEVPFPVAQGLRVGFGALARTVRDVVDATFDNALLRGPLPCVYSDVTDVTVGSGEASQTITVIIPRLLNAAQEARITVTSSNPAVAQPAGGSNGSLTLVFPAGGSNQQTFEVERGGAGIATFTLSGPGNICAANDIEVVSLALAEEQFADNFDGSTLDTSKWEIDPAAFETGTVEGTLTLGAGYLDITAAGTGNYWGGYGVTTRQSFSAGRANPITLEVDRTYLVDNGSTGTRSSIWIMDSTGTNWVMFADLSESGLGWTYNRRINQPGDTVTGGGVDMTALNGGTFDDRGQHRVRLVANGETVRFYIDDVLGAEVPFPVTSGIRFRLGAYARQEFDVVNAGFDNVVVTGSEAPPASTELSIATAGNQVTITWEGAGTLEQTTELGGSWQAVTGAASPYTTPATGMRFFRVRR